MFVGGDCDFSALGGFVWGVDAGEILELSGACFFVETLSVALFADFERRGDVDFEELNPSFARDLTGSAAVVLVGRDEGGDDDDAGVGEELGGFGDAADVFHAVFGGEAEVAVEPVADVVAVEDVGLDTEVE